MTFEQHLERELNKMEAKRNDRRKIGKARQLLLPFRDSFTLQHHIRKISEASGNWPVE